MKNKCFKVFLLLFCTSIFIFGCQKEVSTKYEPGVAPDVTKSSSGYDLNFIDMHNFVIDSLTSEVTPFFYIEEGKFDISGDNDNLSIKVTCTCMDGTTREDVDLFLSRVLNYIAFNAAEQDFRFKAPTTDNSGTYQDFGTVFNTYDLEIDANTTSGEVLRNEKINKGNKIPIEPRYWME